MSKVLEGVTIETFSEAIERGEIKPGQRFAIVLDNDDPEQEGQRSRRPKLAEIAAKMRATAAARGMTTEIFDALLAQK